MQLNTLVAVVACALSLGWLPAELQAADKYALLIGVSRYKHSALNQPQLQFPEDDAREIGELLERSGYEVDLLLSQDAKRLQIKDMLKKVADEGSSDGVVFIGLFGHGIEVEKTQGDDGKSSTAYFCPWDAKFREARDDEGRPLFDKNQQPVLELDPTSLIAVPELLAALRRSPAGARALVADCCRDNPLKGRSAAFGTTLALGDLPPSTAALFACSQGQQAFEHADWGHGALTKALLEEIPRLAESGSVGMGSLTERVNSRVSELVAEVSGGRAKQTTRSLVADVVNLQIDLPPFDAMRARTSSEAADAQQGWARVLGTSASMPNKLGMTLKLIPPGKFMMGSTNAELARVKRSDPDLFAEDPSWARTFGVDEMPLHEVAISKPFYMSAHEVTYKQFAAFVAERRYITEAERDGKGGFGFDATQNDVVQNRKYSWRNAGFRQTDDHPVLNVTWNDAIEFCHWLSKREGVVYRLPTEAEWEYVCRAGTTSICYAGDSADDLADVARVAVEEGDEGTVEVGSSRANGFGLFDMHGNVAEWCSDRYGPTYYAYSPKVDPTGPLVGTKRVTRGGSWADTLPTARSAFRHASDLSARSNDLGFRVVCLPKSSAE